MLAHADSKPATSSTGRSTVLLAILTSVVLGVAPLANAQDWGDDSNEDWNTAQPTEAPARSTAPANSSAISADGSWSFRSGLGFTAGPTTFLLNIEAPYGFNDWLALGPMLQIGLEDNHTLVMPTANLTLKVPDLPGRDFDRVIPYGFAGIGMAYIEREKGGRDREGAGFLITTGFGIEYQVSQRVFFGSQMMLNFLPSKTQGETFIYSWQMGGIRFEF